MVGLWHNIVAQVFATWKAIPLRGLAAVTTVYDRISCVAVKVIGGRYDPILSDVLAIIRPPCFIRDNVWMYRNLRCEGENFVDMRYGRSDYRAEPPHRMPHRHDARCSTYLPIGLYLGTDAAQEIRAVKPCSVWVDDEQDIVLAVAGCSPRKLDRWTNIDVLANP